MNQQRQDMLLASERLERAIRRGGAVDSQALAYLATLRAFRRMTTTALEAECDGNGLIELAS